MELGADPGAQHLQLTEGTKWQPEVWSRKHWGLSRSPRYVVTPYPIPAARNVVWDPGQQVKATLTIW